MSSQFLLRGWPVYLGLCGVCISCGYEGRHVGRLLDRLFGVLYALFSGLLGFTGRDVGALRMFVGAEVSGALFVLLTALITLDNYAAGCGCGVNMSRYMNNT